MRTTMAMDALLVENHECRLRRLGEASAELDRQALAAEARGDTDAADRARAERVAYERALAMLIERRGRP